MILNHSLTLLYVVVILRTTKRQGRLYCMSSFCTLYGDRQQRLFILLPLLVCSAGRFSFSPYSHEMKLTEPSLLLQIAPAMSLQTILPFEYLYKLYQSFGSRLYRSSSIRVLVFVVFAIQNSINTSQPLTHPTTT